ncbi:MAG: hypothetical protein HOP19_21655 [Acidobacteria bacterium]|nr:hypothetical protein [Acidobacteriota bacterium]
MKDLFFLMLALLLAVPMALSQSAEPEVFGAGILSKGEVYRGCFTPDGRSFYFFKKVTPGQEDFRIFISQLVGGKWSEPQRVKLGGEYSDLYPSISKDGRRMVFSSYRPAPGDTSAKPNAHLWYVDRKGDEWGEPIFMSGASQLGYYHSWVEFGFDGGVYFRRTTPDWRTTETLVTRWKGGKYRMAEPVAALERWKSWRAEIRIVGGSFSPNGNVMFLDVATRNPQSGRGASDIWVSFRRVGKRVSDWSEPQPLGANINQEGFDVFPFFSPDGKELFFVRDFATFYRIPLAAALNSVRR